MIDLCLVRVLDYEAQEHLKKKRALECSKCPLRNSCAKWVKENDNTINSKEKETR